MRVWRFVQLKWMSPSSFSVIDISPGAAWDVTVLDDSDWRKARPARIGPYNVVCAMSTSVVQLFSIRIRSVPSSRIERASELIDTD